jgi:hypothetical protein
MNKQVEAASASARETTLPRRARPNVKPLPEGLVRIKVTSWLLS